MITGQQVLELALPHRLSLHRLTELLGELQVDDALRLKYVGDVTLCISQTAGWVEEMLSAPSWEESAFRKLQAQKRQALKVSVDAEPDSLSRSKRLREKCRELSQQCAKQCERSANAISSSMAARTCRTEINKVALEKLRVMEESLLDQGDLAMERARLMQLQQRQLNLY